MRRIVRGKPSPALVVSIIALFVAMGGTGYAAFGLPKNSVGTKQLKRGAVTPAKIAKSTIRLFKGQKGQTGAQGLKGDTGSPGPTGSTGPQGPAGTNAATHAIVRTATTSVADTTTDVALAHCNAGEIAVGGGGSFENTDTKEAIQRTGPLVGGLIASAGSTPDGWFARGYNVSGAPNNLTAFAICVSP
jgi:hypothetical protein